MERFVGKVAVVTGASHGIGKAITKELLKKGVNVVGLGRHMNTLQDLAKEVSANSSIYSGKFHAFQCDVTNEAEVENTFGKIKTSVGPIWILVNNAGEVTQALLMEATEEAFEKNFNLHAKALLLCSKQALKSMVDNSIPGGHLVNIICVTDREITIDDPATKLFIASKVAARNLSEGLRREVVKKKLNVKVTEISPSDTCTRTITEGYPEAAAKMSEMELLQPEQVAKWCMVVLDTPPNVMISESTIRPSHDVSIL